MRLPILRVLFFTLLSAGTPQYLRAQQPPTPPPEQVQPAPAPQQTSQPAPSSSPAQPPNGTQPAQGPVYTIRRTVRLVVLDVVVTDAKGNAIRDLKRDE